ncbi:MAG: hypothetical protein JRC53_03925 [Deltaproteobacteria bacterium]|nr:hypothetical protein [Deltaproteobacteria bacterium]
MRNTKYSILMTLAFFARPRGINWSYASQAKICKLLKKHHNISIKPRCLRYHLKDLEDSGLIKRYQRRDQDEDGTWYMKTTGICLTIKAWLYLFRHGVSWALGKVKALCKKYGWKKIKKPDIYQDKSLPWPERENDRPLKNPFLDPGFRVKLGLPEAPPVKV